MSQAQAGQAGRLEKLAGRRGLARRLGSGLATAFRSMNVRFRNVGRYGFRTPVHRQQIWVDPRQCTLYLPPAVAERLFHTRHIRFLSGRVIPGDWDLEAVDLLESIKLRLALDHWVKGVPWPETGIYSHIMTLIETEGTAIDGCRTLDDIVQRYERLDALYATVKAEGRLRTAFELGKTRARHKEPDGVYFHIGRSGQPIFAGAGCHRLALAIALSLPRIPAMVGVVHPRALDRLECYLPTPGFL